MMTQNICKCTSCKTPSFSVEPPFIRFVSKFVQLKHVGHLFRFSSGFQSRNKKEQNKSTPQVFLSGEKHTYFCAFAPCSFRKEDLALKSVKSTDKIIKVLLSTAYHVQSNGI